MSPDRPSCLLRRLIPGVFFGAALACATSALAQSVHPTPTPTAEPPMFPRTSEHVILITIDGFRPQVYLDSEKEGVAIPNLKALAGAGSFAEGVVVAYPSMTYPSHTSIVTAVSPARHGIISNTIFDPTTGSRLWYYNNGAVQVPSIWDIARKHGVKTAGVSWPVTVGAKMDVIYPESNQVPTANTWLAEARKDSTPGLVDAVVQDLGGFGERDNLDAVKRDRFATAVAVRIIRNEKPNLMVMHLMETDSAQHTSGPGSKEARAAYERVDTHIGEVIRATEEAGIRDTTTFVITGDHGFSRVHSLFQPNVVLRRAGFLKTDAKGNITDFQAVLHGMAIRLADPSDRVVGRRVQGLFEELASTTYKGLFRVVTREELDERGAYPEAQFFIEPAEGYYLADGFDEDAFLVGTTRRGAHGFIPTERRMHTGLILSGAGIRPGVPVPVARQIDIAPTVAKLLGFTMPNVDGVPMEGVLLPPAKPKL